MLIVIANNEENSCTECTLDRFRIEHRVMFIALALAIVLAMSSAWQLRVLRSTMLHEREAKMHDMVDSVVRMAATLDKAGRDAHQTLEAVQDTVKQAIRAMRWSDGDYYGVYRYDGMTLVHGNPKNENVNRLSYVDPSGTHLIADIINLAKASGGITYYSVPRAAGAEPMLKMAYVGRYEPWQWAIQAGVYIDDVDAAVWADMLSDVAIGIGLLLVSGVLVYIIGRSISRPIKQLTGQMQELAAGNTDIVASGAVRRDEVGAMARAVEVFRDGAVERRRLEQAQIEQQALVEAQRLTREREQAELAQEQAFVVSALATGLTRVVANDLTCRVLDVFPPEYDRLRSDFNAAMAQLQTAMQAITGNAQAIRSGTEEIAQASDDLSRRTEQQAASLEETAAALDEITATMRKTAEGAKYAREVVVQTCSDAEHSGSVVRQAVAAMGEIEASSRQVGQIIGVIDEIALQTNLLALNAGVEAARAGDAGRGFAVIASEVRALAQRSAEAAREIKALIHTSAQQVGMGVKLVGETGEILTRILTQVAEVSGVVSEIAAAAAEQASGLAEVNTAVNHMDQVTQQNAAMVEQSTAATHALSQETAALTQLTGRFRLGKEGGGVQAGVPAGRRPAVSASSGQGRAVLKIVSPPGRAGSAARKPTAMAEADGWQDF